MERLVSLSIGDNDILPTPPDGVGGYNLPGMTATNSLPCPPGFYGPDFGRGDCVLCESDDNLVSINAASSLSLLRVRFVKCKEQRLTNRNASRKYKLKIETEECIDLLLGANQLLDDLERVQFCANNNLPPVAAHAFTRQQRKHME